jgi:hypothetical protein
MRHARMLAPLALATVLAASLASVAPDAQAAKRPARTASADAPASPRKAAAYHQFTGTVVSLDASSITVEKGGKTPKRMVFTRHSDMRSTGDVAKDARVTVYWRDEAGKPVAHRVVVKATATGGTD